MFQLSKKKLYAFIYSIILFFSTFQSISSIQLQASNDLIVNDNFWKDTSGNFIYSQGGGVFKFGDTYYWYGVHYKGAETYAQNPSGKNSDTSFVSITCYSSKRFMSSRIVFIDSSALLRIVPTLKSSLGSLTLSSIRNESLKLILRY